MRKRFVLAALGLAALAFAFGPNAARADHCRSGYGGGSYYSGYGGYGGYGYGGYGGYGGIRVVPSYSSYGYGYRGIGSYHGGHHHHHSYYGNRGFYGNRGSSFYLRSPGFSFGIYR